MAEKKTTKKKTTAKKKSTKKSTTKKKTASKSKAATPSKSSAKKTSSKKKAASKKKASTTKKSTTKKAASKTKASTKKAVSKKKAATKKKSTSKKAVTKKKTTKKKAATTKKKATAKKSTSKKTATKKKSTKKKATAKTKKSTSKKATSKKSATPAVETPSVSKKQAAPKADNPLAQFRRMNKRKKTSETSAEDQEIRSTRKAADEDAPKQARSKRRSKRKANTEEEQPAARSQSDLPSGMVRVKQFHPDVQPGGGFIELVVPRDQIPLGAEIISSKPKSKAEAKKKKARQDNEEERDDLPNLPKGGILAAGRKLMSEGRLSYNKATEPTPAPTSSAPAPSASKPAAPAGPAKPAAPSGLGSSFLEGLPKKPVGAPASAAKQALHAAFGGAAAQEAPATKPASGTQSRAGIMVDGKWIEHGAKPESSVDVEHVAPLDSPHKHLQLFELTLVTEKKRKVQAHLMLWPEGKLDLAARINDNDPRPQVLAEEGIRGLGMEERLADLQRWSMREWWDAFLEKDQQPIAASAGSRVVRSTDQVAFVHDPGYLVYRLYQAKNHILEGEYPMLMIKDGEVSFSFLDLTGVDERERITPIRMQEILGDAALPSLPDLTFSATPFHLDGEPLNLKDPERFTLLRDQMENIFQFPVLELPDPLGGTGSIRLHLGLWEMSQDNEKARELRDTAIQEQCISFQASAGYISEIVRRELWRKKDQPARIWAGYTPKQISDSIRDNLYEDFHNMQGFQPKTPGDYQYNSETGEFQIVLRRKRCNHTLLMQGKQKRTKMLALLSIYGDNKRDGLDPLEDYSTLLTHDVWESLASGLSWNNGWMMAPGEESRCLWSDSMQRPMAPVVRHMPPWQQGVALGLFLMNK